MTPDLRPEEVAAVLDQVYRAAYQGRPRRFFLRNEELQRLAGRERSLRPEFYDQLGFALECDHSILISYPRLDPGGSLGFVSIPFADTWPAATDADVAETISSNSPGSWLDLVRARIISLHQGTRGDIHAGIPVSLTEAQLCKIVGRRRFNESWWVDLISAFVKATGLDRRLFFTYGSNKERKFIVTTFEHVRSWHHPNDTDWELALARYRLDESE